MFLQQRLVAVIIYLIIDVLYVLSSQSYYGKHVQAIQGSMMKVGPTKLWAAIASYVVLAMGWVVLVAPVVEQQKEWFHAAFYGFVYGLAVYGVFNFTNYVMFQNYASSLMVRDTLWGTSWLTLFTTLYFLYIRKNNVKNK